MVSAGHANGSSEGTSCRRNKELSVTASSGGNRASNGTSYHGSVDLLSVDHVPSADCIIKWTFCHSAWTLACHVPCNPNLPSLPCEGTSSGVPTLGNGPPSAPTPWEYSPLVELPATEGTSLAYLAPWQKECDLPSECFWLGTMDLDGVHG